MTPVSRSALLALRALREGPPYTLNLVQKAISKLSEDSQVKKAYEFKVLKGLKTKSKIGMSRISVKIDKNRVSAVTNPK